MHHPTRWQARSENKAGNVIRLSAAVLSLGISLPAAAGTLGVCPQGSEGDRPFNQAADLSRCMWVTNDHNASPRAFQLVNYNIYCPGRMSQPTANRVGRMIVDGRTIRDQGQSPMNPVTAQHESARLRPQYAAVPHRYEYGCFLAGKNAVATHLKVQVLALPLGGGGGRHCTFQGSQNGDVAIGARVDRGYTCSPLFHRSERRGDPLWDLAEHLIQRDFLAELEEVRGKACILGGGNHGTDIKCDPCDRSDSLIVRLETVQAAAACPTNTVRIVSAAVASPSTCSSSVQNTIAWNYAGSTSWSPRNINRLCQGAEDSQEPALCFDRVMHSGLSWGGGTKWAWRNAMDLCEGTQNASATMDCFTAQLENGSSWQTAIRFCSG